MTLLWLATNSTHIDQFW